MIQIEQRQDYIASEKIKPEIFNQIGRNINKIADYINTSNSILKVQIEQSQWTEKQFVFIQEGITQEDLATVWFNNVEQAAECEITVETVENGIRFVCETVPDAEIVCSVEVKKIES